MRCVACNKVIKSKLFTYDRDQKLVVETLCGSCRRSVSLADTVTTKEPVDSIGDALRLIWEHGSITIEEIPK